MSPRLHPRERGQAIIIIAMMMVVLMTFLALAVDGGNAYLHRRQAQNASDASSIAGAALMLETGITDGDILEDSKIAVAMCGNGHVAHSVRRCGPHDPARAAIQV